MASNVFTCKDVSFSYGNKPLFQSLNLEIPEGKITTLIGANGSGKTTLFNLMTKNLRPAAGSVFLRRGNVGALRMGDFAKLVAVVHQSNTAPADLSVERLVGYGRFPHRGRGRRGLGPEDARMVSWALSVTGLAPFAQRAVSSLSGGQLQRAWIAMALAQGTKVLLLDEPTTYLDVRFQVETLQLVRRLNREFGITVVMVLHDINQALHYSDHLVALAEGRIIAEGAPKEVVTPGLIRQVYGIDLKVAEVDGEPFVLEV